MRGVFIIQILLFCQNACTHHLLEKQNTKLRIYFLLPFASIPSVNSSFEFSMHYSHPSLFQFMTWAIKIYNVAYLFSNAHVNDTMPCISTHFLNLTLPLYIFPWWNISLFYSFELLYNISLQCILLIVLFINFLLL